MKLPGPSQSLLLGGLLATPVVACDLCAIYRASDARGQYSSGWSLTVAEQFIPYRTEQFDGVEFNRPNPDHLDKSMTHLVVGWNFHERAGLSANLPVIHQSYGFTDWLNGVTPRRLEGSETGVGDLALVGRWLAYDHATRDWGFTLNLLGGVKLPTGDPDRLDETQRSVDAYEAIVGPGHPHDALGTITSGVHLHDLAFGSGSVDGIFGLAGTARWRRLFLNFQAQHYLRTEGAGEYRMGDETIVSGGPGGFLWLASKGTFTVQFNAVYESRQADEFRGRASTHTGWHGWYAGPLLGFTWKSHLSALLGVDVPVDLAGNGFQNLPDYRLNATVSWRF